MLVNLLGYFFHMLNKSVFIFYFELSCSLFILRLCILYGLLGYLFVIILCFL